MGSGSAATEIKKKSVALLLMLAVGVDCLYTNGDYRRGAVGQAKARVRKSLTQQHMSDFGIGVKGGGAQSHGMGAQAGIGRPGSVTGHRYSQTYTSTGGRWTPQNHGGTVAPGRDSHGYGYGQRHPQRVLSHSQQYSHRRVYHHAHPDPHRHDITHSVGTAHRITQNANSPQPYHTHTDPMRIPARRHHHPLNYNAGISPERPYHQTPHGHNIAQGQVSTQKLFQNFDQIRVSQERTHYHPHNHNSAQIRFPQNPHHHHTHHQHHHNIDQIRVPLGKPQHHYTHHHNIDQIRVPLGKPQHHQHHHNSDQIRVPLENPHRHYGNHHNSDRIRGPLEKPHRHYAHHHNSDQIRGPLEKPHHHHTNYQHHHSRQRIRVFPERPHHHHPHDHNSYSSDHRRRQHTVRQRVSHSSQSVWQPSRQFTSRVMDSRSFHHRHP